ncbi:hypothetical protein OIC43_08620 [Streptomyces sp. NBC_00825]|uniref:hypothetical protein n=1 Tax=unclassified Streptomyces TaxID=2593676 RepID=UPI002ED2C80A|nr:hypothetical protein OG832_35080 [Streptomyces sp. NBC_00826]WTH89114.1 hypothetical protein OIC43_08620 [Streptomyces sp. NBC_00825]WTH97842.1 hypothetical protein OHA23_08625 [Streptomyces sp. NBC_00822]
MCDLVDRTGAPLPVCSRSSLKRVIGQFSEMGFFSGKAAVEIEATVFEESIDQARAQGFMVLHPLGGTCRGIYVLSRSRDFTTLLDATAARMDEAGIEVTPVVWTHLTMDLDGPGRCRSTWQGPRSTVRSSGPTR